MTASAPEIRGIEQRLTAYQRLGAKRAGLCAQAVMNALNAPRQGLHSAADVWRLVPRAARRKGTAPRGAIVYWIGGKDGHGHTCFALGDHFEMSVDTRRDAPGTSAVVPFEWFDQNWPNLTYVGWSWFWGAIDTRPASQPPVDVPLPGV